MADASDRGPQWGAAIAIALALHLGVVAVTLIVRDAPPPIRAAAPFQVTMTPAPVTQSPADMPQGVPRDEASPQPAADPKVNLPFPPPPEMAAPAAVTLPRAADRPSPVEPRQAEARQAEAATARPASAPVVAPAVSASALDSWQARLLAQLERTKRYPPKARYFRQQDTILVRFTMDRQGRVLSSRIVRSRAFGDLDAEVLALLKRAQPLVTPPPAAGDDALTQTVTIDFHLD